LFFCFCLFYVLKRTVLLLLGLLSLHAVLNTQEYDRIAIKLKYRVNTLVYENGIHSVWN